ncbi:hypothetical protein JNJ66_05560 [Candidatus Saccharibacteria bacterium]|nr:hypothetical protein [Candidatus Saccharibacteria bacterium]
MTAASGAGLPRRRRLGVRIPTVEQFNLGRAVFVLVLLNWAFPLPVAMLMLAPFGGVPGSLIAVSAATVLLFAGICLAISTETS